MGCDILLIVQVKRGGRWETQRFPTDEQGADETAYYGLGRNYDAFAMLANVRNGWEIEPLAPAAERGHRGGRCRRMSYAVG